jgi:hypothetical protein
MWGAAFATVVAYIVRLIVIHELSQRVYRIDYDWPRITKLYAVFVAAFALRSLLGDRGIVLSVTVGALLTSLCVWVVYSRLLHSWERRALIELVRGRIRRRGTPGPRIGEDGRRKQDAPVEVTAEI